jgi:uncharacterized lipoprotein
MRNVLSLPVLVALVIGCSAYRSQDINTVDERILLDSYENLFAGTVKLLEDQGFAIDSQDRESGIVETTYKEIPVGTPFAQSLLAGRALPARQKFRVTVIQILGQRTKVIVDGKLQRMTVGGEWAESVTLREPEQELFREVVDAILSLAPVAEVAEAEEGGS